MLVTRDLGACLLFIASLAACAEKQPFEQAMGLDVNVESIPSGAVVTENETTVGTTPTRFELQDKAEHVLVLRKDGYHPFEVKVNGAEVAKTAGGTFSVGLAPQNMQAASVSVDDPNQLMRAAREALNMGNAADAVQFYRRVIALAPAQGPGYKGLGIAYTKLGKRREALDAYRQYLLYAPDAKDAKEVEAIVNKGTAGIDIPPPKPEPGF